MFFHIFIYLPYYLLGDYMLVFHGGFTKEQVFKLKNNCYELYRKTPYEFFRIKQSNTFQYYNIESKNKKEIINNIIEENYINQWIHCFKYLNNALDFCEENYNYIVVFEIQDDILEKFVGVGNYKYEGYKIEYRIPRSEISSDNIVDIIKFESFDKEKIKILKNLYHDQFLLYNEHEEAKKILKKTKQKCKYI